VTTINYARIQTRADRLLRKVGTSGILRRSSGDRVCIVAFASPTVQERAGNLFQWSDKHAYVSAAGLSPPPDQEEDKLIVGGVTYDIVAPPGKFDPAGTVVYWDLHVRK
jgi:hypothetical protein